MTLHVQLMTMITMVVGGIYVGFAFETYRGLTHHLRKNTFLKYVLEISFWLIQTILLFYVLYRVNQGELRVYVFLACLLGFSIYSVIFKDVYQRILVVMINIGKTVWSWIIKSVLVLFIQPVLWFVNVIYLIIKGISHFFIRLLSYPVNWFISLCKWMLPESFFKKVSQYHALCSTIVNKLLNIVKKTIGKWR